MFPKLESKTLVCHHCTERHFLPTDSSSNWTQTMLHLDEPGTLKSTFFMIHAAPLVRPTSVSMFKAISAGKPIPSVKIFGNPMVNVGSDGILLKITSCKDGLTSPEISSKASMVSLSF